MGGEKNILLLLESVGGKRNKEKKERKREREREGGRTARSSSNLWLSDNRSSLGRELKFVYSTRAKLQEVEILPTLVISTLRAVRPCFLP